MEAALFEGKPVLAVCGGSGSGKSMLLQGVIPLLVGRGLRVAVVTYEAHEAPPDSEGRGAVGFFAAGADVHRRGKEERSWESRPRPEDQRDGVVLRLLATHDLVLVETPEETPLPKVWCLGRKEDRVPDGLSGLVAVLPCDVDRSAALVSIVEERVQKAWKERSIYGGILVGGRSSRMGSPKQFLSLGDRSLFSRVAVALREKTERIVALGEGGIPDDGGVVDHVGDAPGAGRGPVAGLLTALRWAPGVCWVIGACDMPGINREAVEWLIEQRQPGRWAIIPRDAEGRLEPTLALYEPQAKPLIEGLVLRGERAPRGLDQWSEVHTPPIPDRLSRAWANVNTPGELQAFEEIHNGRQSGGPTSGPPRSSSR